MELLSKSVSVVTEVTYVFQDDVSSFTYKEWLDESNKVVDSILRDKDGHEIDDPELYDTVCHFVDSL